MGDVGEGCCRNFLVVLELHLCPLVAHTGVSDMLSLMPTSGRHSRQVNQGSPGLFGKA